MTHTKQMQEKAREGLWETLDADGISKVDQLIAEVVKETEERCCDILKSMLTNEGSSGEMYNEFKKKVNK